MLRHCCWTTSKLGNWFFDENNADSWGVETNYPNIFICGAGAKRGGGVSGIPGHNAARAVLEKLAQSN